MKSSSIHNLNADKGLSDPKKIAYLFLNWINNLLPFINVDKRIIFEKPDLYGWQDEWEKTYPDSSVARKLSDLFWRTLPWGKILEELGEINILDTGCGRGNYGARISESSKGLVKSYTGIDAKRRPDWNELKDKYPNFNFIESNSSDIRPLIPKETNFFITQSAIEHFDEDLLFFEHIKEFIDKSSKPIMQVHVFPGAATLPLYLFHGLRQYNPRTISKITRIFSDDDTEISLKGLGGNSGKILHFKYFTWPTLILRKKRKSNLAETDYPKKIFDAIERDFLNPSKSPIFWALTIKSNFPKNKHA